jgi:antibiotic biosynthesis monooxygenase (ABM) superfamily enzyme
MEESLPALFDTVDSKVVKRAIDVKSETGSPKRSPKKLKRTYATPETYAHLNGLHDWLKDELDGKSLVRWSFCLLMVIVMFSSYVLWNKVTIISRKSFKTLNQSL